MVSQYEINHYSKGQFPRETSSLQKINLVQLTFKNLSKLIPTPKHALQHTEFSLG
jgi:hypothetical protein